MSVTSLDQDLAKKRSEQYDNDNEKEVRGWISTILGEELPTDQSFQEILKNGVILCKLANKIEPGIIRKINTSKMPFMQMENISAYLNALKKFGVPAHETFQTIDLYENKNMLQVLNSFFALSRTLNDKGGYDNIPLIGPKLAKSRECSFTEEQLREGLFIAGKYSQGYTGGSSQSGMSFGNRREIVYNNPFKNEK
jgi:hypothetical protein